MGFFTILSQGGASEDGRFQQLLNVQDKVRNFRDAVNHLHYFNIMKISVLSLLVLAMGLLSFPAFSQTEKEPDLLGLPGDNLDLYAVLDLFQKSKTIEEFEKELNLEKTGINNLDLDLDGKVDFIKVETKQKDDDFTFILQVAVSEKETQDVAVILVSKDEKKEVTMQIVGDKDLYGKDYIIEPQDKPGSTANPGYTGDDPVKENVPATTTTVVVQSAPIVQYVYSPAYVPYYPPYYYGYYPPYFAAFSVMAVGIYWSNHSYYHHGGYGYGHTTVIHNTNNFYNYNNNRNTSNTVAKNRENGSYNKASSRPSTGASASTRPSTGTTKPSASTRPSTGSSTSTRPSTSPSTRPSTGSSTSTRPSTGSSASTRPSTSPSTRPSTGSSTSTRPSTSTASRPSSSSSMGASRSMHSGSSYSGGASRSSGGYSGGASRGGGGGRRR
jgi:hypothetical protein